MNQISITLVGGPTVVMKYAGLTIVTDPTFDLPGTIDDLVKTEGPAVDLVDVGPIDLALVSHDEHADNLDVSGLEAASSARTTITTLQAARRHKGFIGLRAGRTLTLPGGASDDGTQQPEVTVTAVRGLHGPWWARPLVGPVSGYILRAEGWATVYFSGDNASVSVVRRIAAAHPDVDVLLMCLGAAKAGPAWAPPLTLTAARGAQVAALWPRATIVPIHMDGWEHFSEQRAEGLERLEALGLGDRVVSLERGVASLVG